MASKTTKYLIGLLTVVIAATSVYVMISGSVKIDVQPGYTSFYIWNGSWIKSGTEYGILYNGTKQVNVTSTVINTTFLPGNMTQITRTRLYKGGASVIDTYLFDGNTKDINLFPVLHRTDIYNATGLIFNYEVRGLSGNITNKALNGTEAEFGLKMKVVWSPGYYSANSYTSGSKIIIRYRINSTNYTLNNRLFDPDLSVYTSKSFFTKLKTNYADLSYGEATFDLYQPSLVDISIDSKWLNFTTHKYLGRSGVDSMDIFYGTNVTITTDIPVYTTYCENKTATNGSTITNCTLVLDGIKKQVNTEYKYLPISELDILKAKTTYDIKVVGHWKADPQKSIDWIPNLNLGTNKYSMLDWAWWNTSWDKCLQINISGTYPANYTHAIELWNSTFNFTNILSTGADIRTINGTCSGGGSEIYHIVPEWNTSRNNNIIFVKTTGDSTTDNKISVFFNYSSATDNSDWNNTFMTKCSTKLDSTAGYTQVGGAATVVTANRTINWNYAEASGEVDGVYCEAREALTNFSIWYRFNQSSMSGSQGAGPGLASFNNLAQYNSGGSSVFATAYEGAHYYTTGEASAWDFQTDGAVTMEGKERFGRITVNATAVVQNLSLRRNMSSPDINIVSDITGHSFGSMTYFWMVDTFATGYGTNTIVGWSNETFLTKFINPEPTFAFGVVETYVPPPPVITVIFPLNNTRSQNYTLAVSVNSNNSVMNVNFYNMTSGGAICTNTSVTNGTFYCNWATLACGTAVTWNATVTDTSTTVQTGLYNFTYNCAPVISDAMSNATTIDAFQSARFNATVVFDSDNDTVKFYVQAPYGNLNLSSSGSSGSHYWLICNSTNPCKTNTSGTYLMSSVWANDTSNITASLASTANFVVNPPILTLCLNGNCTSDMRYELGSKAQIYANATFSNGSIMNVSLCLNLTTDSEQSELSCSNNGTIQYNWTTTAYNNKLTCYNNLSDCEPSTSGIVSYWSMNDMLISERNQTVIYDQSGYGNNGNYTGEIFNNGTITNPTYTSWVNGMFGYALNLSNPAGGTMGYITTPAATNYTFNFNASGFTIEAWVKASRLGSGTTRRIIDKEGSGATPGAGFVLSIDGTTNKLSCGVANESSSSIGVSHTTAVVVDSWYHVACVFDINSTNGGKILMYINGTNTANSSAGNLLGNIFNTTKTLTIGTSSGLYGGFNGTVDEIRIHNKTLSQTDIINEMYSSYPVSGDKLVFYMPFNEGTGTGIKDWHNFVVGHAGTALNFINAANLVKTGNYSSLNISGPITISAWVRSYSDFSLILAKNTSGG